MQVKNEGAPARRARVGADFGDADSDIQGQWARVRARLRDEFGEAAFRSWLRAMTLLEVEAGRVRIGVPTRFLRDWVAAHYADRIRTLWLSENGAISAIEVVVTAGAAAADTPPPATSAARIRSSARC